MAYVTPTSKTTGDLIAATDWNQNTVDNPVALRTGGIAIASQAAGDIITASSSTQLGRSAITGFGLHTVCDGRLTLTTGTPVTTSDVTAATTVYFAPYKGRQIGLYDGSSAWAVVSFNELSIAVPATTNTIYDVYIYNNSGTATLELTAWTNDTTRATALTTQDGVYVKTGATTRRYVGSFRTTAVSGQTEDSASKRFVWNYHNRVDRAMQLLVSTSNWTYSTPTWRQANNSTTNQLACVVGVAEDAIEVATFADTSCDSVVQGAYGGVSVGVDITNNTSSGAWYSLSSEMASTNYYHLHGGYNGVLAAGYHYLAMIEYSSSTGTRTWYGSSSRAGIVSRHWRA